MQFDDYKIIGGHRVSVPVPKSKSIIQWGDEKDPYWDRQRMIEQYPDLWFDFIPKSSKSDIYTRMWTPATRYDDNTGLLLSLNEEDSNMIERIYLQEKDRRINGFHFRNGDEVQWLTGDHYFFLMYARMQRHDGKGLYADYREFQSDYFYLINHCFVSPHILGLFCSKPKKTGITNAHLSGLYLNRSTLYANQNLGLMNIDAQQAAKTFNDYFLYAYNGMISPLKPEYKSRSEKEGSITFAETHRQGKSVSRRGGEDSDLNTNVFCVPSRPKAFDVAVMNITSYDEPTKVKENFGEIWRTNKEAIKIQTKFNGRAFLFNYTSDQDTDSFRECRKIYEQSELSTIISGSSRTQSELINYHIPAYGAWEGCFNKQGKCDESRALKEIQFERDKVRNDKRALQAMTRQYANTKKEAWASAGAGSTFDNIRLGDLKSDVEEAQRLSPEPLYQEGKLVWENSLWETGVMNKRPKGQFCNVKFVPLSENEIITRQEGRLRIYHDVPVHLRNSVLRRGKDEWGCLLPPERFLYVGGADPTSYAAGSEVTQGSKNAYHTMSMPDERMDSISGEVVSKRIVSEYFYRPESPNDAYEDLVKEIIYFGKLCIVEGNSPFTATSLLEDRLGHFLLIRNENGVIARWERHMGLPEEEDKKYNLIRITSNSANSKEMLDTLVRLIINYIQEPGDGEKDYGKTIPSERVLQQLMDFNPLDTRVSDLPMCLGYTLLCLEIYIGLLLAPSEDQDSVALGAMMRALANAS